MPISLKKGQKVSLSKENPGLTKVLVGLGWDVNAFDTGGSFDLDAAAFLLGENGKITRTEDFVFYGNLQHPSGAVEHLGDNLTGVGEGDDELGRILLKGFLFALTQQEKLPSTLLFYNGGARVTCEGSPSLEDLKNLAALGVEILTCGTCLSHYGLTDRLQVGGVTNMYVITEKQMQADLVLRP